MQDPDGDASKGYDNTKITTDFIKSSGADYNCTNHDGACIVNYLMTKIGTGQSVKDGGLCRAVLDKCQYYTYDQNGKVATYKPYNDVVVSYIQRAMVNIKAAQAKIISNYASTCMANVEDCYNQQNTQITSWSTAASVDSIYRVMTGACYNVALTCGYAVFAHDESMSETSSELDLIHGISEMFYQSLLCPENSIFSNTKKINADNPSSYVNDRCVCKENYYVYGAACVSSCPVGYMGSNGVCVIATEEESTDNTNETDTNTGGNSTGSGESGTGSSGSDSGSGSSGSGSSGSGLDFNENPYSGGNSTNIYEEPGNDVRP